MYHKVFLEIEKELNQEQESINGIIKDKDGNIMLPQEYFYGALACLFLFFMMLCLKLISWCRAVPSAVPSGSQPVPQAE